MVSSTSASSSITGHDCPHCKGRGLVIIGNGRDVSAKQCSCVEQRKMANILANSRITPEFQKLRFNNFDTRGKHPLVVEACQMAYNYVKKFKNIKNDRCNSLALLGQPGVGKTHLSCAISNELMDKGVKVLYFPHREGFSELKDALSKNSDYKRDKESECGKKISLMKNADLLVWDDLFKGRLEPTNFEMDTVFEVINYRYLNHLPMIISSEKLHHELLVIDQAIGSRIIEVTKGHIKQFAIDPTLNHRLTS